MGDSNNKNNNSNSNSNRFFELHQSQRIDDNYNVSNIKTRNNRPICNGIIVHQ